MLLKMLKALWKSRGSGAFIDDPSGDDARPGSSHPFSNDQTEVATATPNDSDQKAAAIPVTPPCLLTQARHGLVLVNPNDLYLGRAMLLYGECCELEIEFLRKLIEGSGLIVEVGANIGTHTLPLAKEAALRSQEVIAFEPQPFVFQNFCANLALNSIANVRAWPWACGAEQGTVYFRRPDYLRQGNFGGVAMLRDAAADTIAVPCVRLDDVLDARRVDLIKLDVEGFELAVLQGAAHTLAQSRPMLYVENDRVDKSRALIEWLWAQDYHLWWHVPMLFNPRNFRGLSENIYQNIGPFNLLGLHRSSHKTVEGLNEVTDSSIHPLAAR